MTNESFSTPPVKNTSEKSEKNKINVKKLPEDVETGSTLTFTDTITANPDDFSSILLIRIAKKFKLDFKKDDDYKKIIQISKKTDLVEPIKKQITQEAVKSLTVSKILVPKKIFISKKTEEAEIKRGHNSEFFERFKFLPEMGLVKVSPKEVKAVESVYIGGGTTTEAFINLGENQIYGDTEAEPTYFSSDYEIALTHVLDENENKNLNPILIEVSLPKLMKFRDIFKDPESLYIKSENEKNYIVFYGIPVQAIKRIIILKN